jgi:hypothetical protein
MKNLTINQLQEIYFPLKEKFLSGEFMTQKQSLLMNKALYLITAKKYNWKY